VVDQRDARLRLLHDRGQLPRAEGRDRGHDDAARLQHAEPGGDRPGVVRRAQQHPVARNQPQVLHQDLGDLVGAPLEIAVGPDVAVRRAQGGTVGAEGRDRDVDDLGRRVEPVGVLQGLGRELQRRPLLGRRQVVTRESVAMG
jgi:hypothetical protein